jgi:hypothetical protein
VGKGKAPRQLAKAGAVPLETVKMPDINKSGTIRDAMTAVQFKTSCNAA